MDCQLQRKTSSARKRSQDTLSATPQKGKRNGRFQREFTSAPALPQTRSRVVQSDEATAAKWIQNSFMSGSLVDGVQKPIPITTIEQKQTGHVGKQAWKSCLQHDKGTSAAGKCETVQLPCCLKSASSEQRSDDVQSNKTLDHKDDVATGDHDDVGLADTNKVSGSHASKRRFRHKVGSPSIMR